jgi:hypothetical protein
MKIASQVETQKNHQLFKWCVVTVYLLISGFFLTRHAMWRDELQLWLIASKSESLSELISNKQLEVRPYLWFLICWVLSRFSRNPEILKSFNFGIAVALAYILVFRFKNSLLLQIGFLFGFLTLFGYSALTQEYLLGTLIFVLSMLHIQNKSRHLCIFLLASILANTNLLFAIVSIGVAAIPTYLILKDIRSKYSIHTSDVFGIPLYLGLFVFSLVSMSPPSNFAYKSTSLNLDLLAFKRMIVGASSSLFPFMKPNRFSEYLWSPFTSMMMVFTVAAILVLIICSFKKSTAVGLSSAICMTGIILWFGIGYALYWWHFGILFIAYFGFAVIAIPGWNQARQIQKLGYALTVIILVSQSTALFVGPSLGLFPYRPYSMARDTASFVQKICQNQCTVITDSEVTGTSISAYMESDTYRPSRNAFGSFTIWDGNVYRGVSWNDLIASAKKFNDPIFVTSGLANPPSNVQILSEFSGAVWESENFIVSKPIPYHINFQ